MNLIIINKMKKIFFYFLLFTLLSYSQEETHIDNLFTIIDAQKQIHTYSTKVKFKFINILLKNNQYSSKLDPAIDENFIVFEEEIYFYLRKRYLKKFSAKKVEKLILEMNQYEKRIDFLKKIDFFKELEKAKKCPKEKLKINLQNEFERLGIE